RPAAQTGISRILDSIAVEVVEDIAGNRGGVGGARLMGEEILAGHILARGQRDTDAIKIRRESLRPAADEEFADFVSSGGEVAKRVYARRVGGHAALVGIEHAVVIQIDVDGSPGDAGFAAVEVAVAVEIVVDGAGN